MVTVFPLAAARAVLRCAAESSRQDGATYHGLAGQGQSGRIRWADTVTAAFGWCRAELVRRDSEMGSFTGFEKDIHNRLGAVVALSYLYQVGMGRPP